LLPGRFACIKNGTSLIYIEVPYGNNLMNKTAYILLIVFGLGALLASIVYCELNGYSNNYYAWSLGFGVFIGSLWFGAFGISNVMIDDRVYGKT